MIEYAEDQVEKVLTAVGARLAGDAPNDIILFCPYHSNARTPAAEVSKDTGVFYCFACQRHASLVDLVCFVSNMGYFEALRLIEKYKDESSIVDSVAAKLNKVIEYEPYDIAVMSRLHAACSGVAFDYLSSRGITKQSIEDYFLGYSGIMDMVVFPYYDPEGRFIVGFQGRSIHGKDFKNSTGTKKSQTLFGINLYKWSPEVFCFESPIDSILAHQHGIPAVSTMGANPSKTQIDIMSRYFNRVYVVADSDSVGKASAFKTCEKLGGHGIMVLPPNGYKDIGEMPYEDIPSWAAKVKNPVGILE